MARALAGVSVRGITIGFFLVQLRGKGLDMSIAVAQFDDSGVMLLFEHLEFAVGLHILVADAVGSTSK